MLFIIHILIENIFKMAEILLIDNFDSFTYNLVDQLRIKNHKVKIYRNNVPVSFIYKELLTMKNPILIISPGPGIPANAGYVPIIINTLKGKIPIIGICLGHQAIIESYGGIIIKTNNIFHGKISFIIHDGDAMFFKMINPLPVARYHSMVGEKISSNLIVNAYYKKIIMAIRNDFDKTCGFQFHPESILTPQGENLLENTINWVLS